MVGAKQTKTDIDKPANNSNENSRPYVSALKYYIHDGTKAFRFQLIGELREADVKELTGCWQTAKSTFGSRKLVLDLRALRTTDDGGKEWLLAMVREGATCEPESYFRSNLAEQVQTGSGTPQQSSRFLSKLTSGLSADSEIPAGSPTQAP